MERAGKSETHQLPSPAVHVTAMRRPSGLLILAIMAAFVVLAIGGYKFDWTWTGFKGNTLWDWLHLLLLPVVLTLATVWILRHHTWQQWWTVTMVVFGVAMIVLIIGGYALNWSWTGFKGNTFWNWLELFLLPVVLTVVTAWYSVSSTPEDDALGGAITQQFIQTNLEEASAPHE